MPDGTPIAFSAFHSAVEDGRCSRCGIVLFSADRRLGMLCMGCRQYLSGRLPGFHSAFDELPEREKRRLQADL